MNCSSSRLAIALLIVMEPVYNAVSAYSQNTQQETPSASEFFNLMQEVDKVTVATQKATDIRETPAIVSVITEEDLKNSGARDLKDALELLVPGFHFAADQNNTESIGFRGIWGEEGKILVLVDGLETNERVYGTTVFGNRYPIDQIERIEIMRGPGSVIYGGFAELAVISITTKGAKQHAAYATAMDSQMSRTYSHRGGTVGIGDTIGDFSGSFNGTAMQGNRTQRFATDYNGLTMDESQFSGLDLMNGNLALGYKGLNFRAYSDDYWTTNRDMIPGFYTGPEVFQNYFKTTIFELKYDYKLADGVTLTPRAEYNRDTGWEMDQIPIGYTNHKTAEKETAGLNGLWDVTKQLNLMGGFEIYKSILRSGSPGPFEADSPLPNGQTSSSFNDVATLGQAILKSDIANLTAGFRWDKTTQFGGAFVPRLAATKVMGPAHVKVMYSESFRVPVGILPDRTLPGAPSLKPEKATTYEVELGYKLTPGLSTVLSAYQVTIHSPIVYSPGIVGSYSNFGKIGTRGIQPEFRYRSKSWDFTANYSYYYKIAGDIPEYGNSSTAPKGIILGAPTHEFNAFARIGLTQNTSVNPSVHFVSKRYGQFNSTDPDPYEITPQYAVWNINFRATNLIKDGLEIDLSIDNIFDQGNDTAPGYTALENVTPGLSRAYVIKLGYKFGLPGGNR